MSIYFDYTLYVVDRRARLQSELHGIIEELESEGWEVSKESDMCVVLFAGGENVAMSLTRFPKNPEVLFVMSTHHELSEDNHCLCCTYFANYVYGSFDGGGEVCESDAIPSQINDYNAICDKSRRELGDEYLSEMKVVGVGEVVPLSKWLTENQRSAKFRQEMISQKEECEKLFANPDGLDENLDRAIDEVLAMALSGEWNKSLFWELGIFATAELQPAAKE